jgi:hypothetical protein
MMGFIGPFDIQRDNNLQFTITHSHTHTLTLVSTVTSSLAVAVYRIKKLKRSQGPKKGYRVIDISRVMGTP